MKTQYDARTDAVVYGPTVASFDTIDWLRLAVAAIDQAGLSVHAQVAIVNIIERDAGVCLSDRPKGGVW